METLSYVMERLNFGLLWACLIWLGVGLVVGSVLIARDEWRLWRTRPKPEAVRAYADELEATYGGAAFRLNGEAMCAARAAKDFDRYRFLKEVSGELAARLVSQPVASG
jgi:hypothetical protein